MDIFKLLLLCWVSLMPVLHSLQPCWRVPSWFLAIPLFCYPTQRFQDQSRVTGSPSRVVVSMYLFCDAGVSPQFLHTTSSSFRQPDRCLPNKLLRLHPHSCYLCNGRGVSQNYPSEREASGRSCKLSSVKPGTSGWSNDVPREGKPMKH